jgi:outer membrane protein
MKAFTKTLLTAGLVSTALCSVPAMADTMKVGVIDMRTIVSTAPQAKAALEKLKKEFKTREDQMLATEKSLKEKSEKLQRNASVMSEAEKTKLEKEVVAGQRDLQRIQTEIRDDATVRQQEEMKKIITKVNTAVQDIAKKEKYDLIIHSEAAPFAAKQLDITDKVLKAMGTGA